METLAKSTESEIAPPKPITSTISISGTVQYPGYGRGDANQPKRNEVSGDYELTVNDPNEATCTVTVTAFGKHQ